jgi:hypothetical protein
LSTDQEKKYGINVFPNPTTGQVSARWDRSAAFTDLRISDLHGAVVAARKVDAVNQVEMDITRLPSGVYILQLSGASATEVYKLVLTR